MNAIGGYFEMELPNGGSKYHQAITFKSGRSALKCLIQQIQPKKVYIPFYTCDALLQPFAECNVQFAFYKINLNLDPEHLPELSADEYLLYINYFDLKRETVALLSEKYGAQLIVDCSQAFFMKANGKSWFFNSCRKFFGVPDGAYLMPPDGIEISPVPERNENYTVQHLIKRLEGNTEEGFEYYKENEVRCGSEIKSMSIITERLLSHLNYHQVAERRIQNFTILHDFFGKYNQLRLSQKNDGVPMVYPLLLKQKADHQKLWAQKVYVPIYWSDILKRNTKDFTNEVQLTNNMLPLPVDQRYHAEDMIYLAKIIEQQC